MKWQIWDNQGTIRFGTETYPFDSRDVAEDYIEHVSNDAETVAAHPEWFPMYLVGVPS